MYVYEYSMWYVAAIRFIFQTSVFDTATVLQCYSEVWDA